MVRRVNVKTAIALAIQTQHAAALNVAAKVARGANVVVRIAPTHVAAAKLQELSL